MKNKVMMVNLVVMLLASVTYAQRVENDDMYFNSKDRAKLKAQKASEEASYVASVKKTKKSQFSEEEFNNPTDSYSARNVNPEFAARSNSQIAQADNEDYFVNNYRYNNSSNLNNWNNNFNNWYSNPWYSANYFGPSINAWNSPYYGSNFDSWGNPWANPYYRSGWSSSFSYHWGSPWNYGWGNGMGMNFGYGNPYMNSWSSWGPSFGYGYNSWFCPSNNVFIINNGGESGRNIAYGKRASHGGMVTTPQDAVNNRTRSNYVPTSSTGGRQSNPGGRVVTQSTNQRQEDYYNRSWRNSQQSGQGSAPSRSSSNNGWSNSSNRSSNSDTFYRQGSNSNSYSSPSRSSSFDGGGGATRSSAPASSGSNGRTRGRD
jgi:hypothetical protein